ncbi:MAG: hypothetical protein KDA58_14225, partial [Planctomycetaceae bacterium]|nr:hypothetical protein [Planctomycetaceae bacterium]
MPAIRCCLASYLCLIAATASTHAGAIFPDGAKPEQLWNKGTFTEGVAVAPDGKIYFSDISRGDDPGRILRFDPASGETSVYCADSGQSNGLMFDATGRLLAACGANNGRRALVEIRNDGSVHELA